MALIKKYEIRQIDASYSKTLDQMQMEHAFDGDIELQYLRLPDPWHSLQMERGDAELYLTTDTERNAPMGYGSVIYRNLFLNGEKQKIGYLGNLKVMHAYQRKYIPLHRSYTECFRQRPADASTMYISTILESNEKAIKVLTANRKFMPQYKQIGNYVTTIQRGRGKALTNSYYTFEEIELKDIRPWLVFYNAEASRFNFSPSLEESELAVMLKYGNARIIGLSRNNWPVAFAVLIEPSRYKQTIVRGYKGKYRLIRLVNMWNKYRKMPKLPRKGKAFPLTYFSYVAIKDADPELFEQFMTMARKRVRGKHMFVTGFSDQHPFDQVMKKTRSIRYESRMYSVFPNDLSTTISLDPDKIVHFECVEL
jgi:hypothetical protein